MAEKMGGSPLLLSPEPVITSQPEKIKLTVTQDKTHHNLDHKLLLQHKQEPFVREQLHTLFCGFIVRNWATSNALLGMEMNKVIR